MAAKGVRTRYYTRRILDYTRRNIMFIVLAALFLLGILCATLLLGSAGDDIREFLTRLVDGFARKKLTQQIKENFISSFLSSAAFVAVLFVCGFCAIAQPFVVLLPFLRGLGIGFSLAGLYAHYGAPAIGFAAIYTVSTLISASAMMVCCIEALRMSSGLFGALRSGERAAFYPPGQYLVKFAGCVLLCVFASALEAVLYSVFANYVVLG